MKHLERQYWIGWLDQTDDEGWRARDEPMSRGGYLVMFVLSIWVAYMIASASPKSIEGPLSSDANRVLGAGFALVNGALMLRSALIAVPAVRRYQQHREAIERGELPDSFLSWLEQSRHYVEDPHHVAGLWQHGTAAEHRWLKAAAKAIIAERALKEDPRAGGWFLWRSRKREVLKENVSRAQRRLRRQEGWPD